MSRAVEEWVAKHDDQKVPPRVRLRIFEREAGVCHITGRKIQTGEKWELEHKIPLILGGEHREANLFPALVEPHKAKTAAEMKVKAKTDTVRKKHLGITRPKQTIKSAPFATSEKADRRNSKPPLPPRQLFQEAKANG